MPAKKKAEVAEVKAEAVKEAAKKAVVEAPVEEKKPVEKKAADKKPVEKKAGRKPAAKPAIKQTVKVQFGGEEFDLAEVQKAVEADIKSKFKGRIKTVEVYIKPEDRAVYYVVNSDFSDKVVL